MWGDVRRHTNGNTRGTIDQQIRNASRQYHGDLLSAVVVVDKINRFFIKIREQRMRDFRHANFGVTHRSGRIAVNRSEITLSIDQRITQGKVLRHADNRVVNCRIAMGMIFTDHIAHDPR